MLQPAGPVGIAFHWCSHATVVSFWQSWHSWRSTQTLHLGEQRQHARGHWPAQWVFRVRPRALQPDEMEPGIARGGWQHEAASRVERHFRQEVLFERMGSRDQAILRSQGGSGAGLALTVSPTTLMTKIPPHLFRTILLRRLCLPLPFSRNMCRCGRPIDSFGHRASCTRTGALGWRGFALESVAARVCREAGARGPGSRFVSPSSRRQLQIGSGRPFSVGPSWPWTRLWCVLYIAMVRRTQQQPTRTEWCSNEPGGARNVGTQSWWAEEVGRASLFWPSKLEGGGHLSCRRLSPSSPSPRLEQPFLLLGGCGGGFPRLCNCKGGCHVSFGLEVRARCRRAHLPGLGGRGGPPAHGAGP